MTEELILLPMKAVGKDAAGEPIEEPDFLGVDPDKFTFEVKTNYHDVAKVLVSGSRANVKSLHEASREHFKAAWAPPKP